MRIVCPACAATYDVPDSLVPAGRVVRCARCHADWAAIPAGAAPESPRAAPAPEPAMPLPAAPAPAMPLVAMPAAATPELLATGRRMSAMERLAAPAPKPRSPLLLRAAWAASVAVLVLAAGAAILWRGEIVAAWPPSGLAYAALGMHPGGPPR